MRQHANICSDYNSTGKHREAGAYDYQGSSETIETREQEGMSMGSHKLVCVCGYMDHVDSFKPLQRIWLLEESSMQLF